jgi:hypothetical protein
MSDSAVFGNNVDGTVSHVVCGQDLHLREVFLECADWHSTTWIARDGTTLQRYYNPWTGGWRFADAPKAFCERRGGDRVVNVGSGDGAQCMRVLRAIAIAWVRVPPHLAWEAHRFGLSVGDTSGGAPPHARHAKWLGRGEAAHPPAVAVAVAGGSEVQVELLDADQTLAPSAERWASVRLTRRWSDFPEECTHTLMVPHVQVSSTGRLARMSPIHPGRDVTEAMAGAEDVASVMEDVMEDLNEVAAGGGVGGDGAVGATSGGDALLSYNGRLRFCFDIGAVWVDELVADMHLPPSFASMQTSTSAGWVVLPANGNQLDCTADNLVRSERPASGRRPAGDAAAQNTLQMLLDGDDVAGLATKHGVKRGTIWRRLERALRYVPLTHPLWRVLVPCQALRETCEVMIQDGEPTLGETVTMLQREVLRRSVLPALDTDDAMGMLRLVRQFALRGYLCSRQTTPVAGDGACTGPPGEAPEG